MSTAQFESPDAVNARICTVSPPMAALWLKANMKNRNVRRDAVEAYSRDMAAGNWLMTGEPVKFDTQGNLIDGQHRLLAIIAANVPVDLMVVRGVAPETQEVMDSGIKRSAGDTFALRGYKNTNILVAAARVALTEPGAGFVAPDEQLRMATHSEIVEFVAEWDGPLQRAVEHARLVYKGMPCPPAVIAVAWMRLSQIDMEACYEFFYGIAEQRTEGVGDPRLALARRLANIKADRSRVKNNVYLSLVFRAWNAWRQGQKVRMLPTHVGNNEPVRIPERLR